MGGGRADRWDFPIQISSLFCLGNPTYAQGQKATGTAGSFSGDLLQGQEGMGGGEVGSGIFPVTRERYSRGLNPWAFCQWEALKIVLRIKQLRHQNGELDHRGSPLTINHIALGKSFQPSGLGFITCKVGPNSRVVRIKKAFERYLISSTSKYSAHVH